jgi:chitin-binding protein
MAFYQVVDLDFVPPEGGGERPSAPTGLKAVSVTDKRVELAWNAAVGPAPIAFYRIRRDGMMSVDVQAPLLTWTDNSVAPESTYNYFVTALDEKGNASDPSRPIQVQTLPEGGEGPTAPTNLHKMGQTANSIKLMWGASSGTAPVINYLVYRDDVEIRSVAATEYEDGGLTPDTEYAYVVKARDLNGKLSKPSNLLKARTQAGGGEHPAWRLDTFYETGALVSHAGENWRCLQRHTSYTPDWAPGLESSEVLWVKA